MTGKGPECLPDAGLLNEINDAVNGVPSPVENILCSWLNTLDGGVAGQRKVLSRLKMAIRNSKSGQIETISEKARKTLLDFLAFLIRAEN